MKILQVQKINLQALKSHKQRATQKTLILKTLWKISISEQPSQKSFPRISSAHKEDMIIGRKEDPIRTRSSLRINEDSLFGLVSLIEPTSIDEALEDNDWILAMQDEINQFSRNDVWV